MSIKQFSNLISNNYFDNYISKNKGNCEPYETITLFSRELDDIYHVFYRILMYNLTLIKNLTTNVNSMGKINNNSKKNIIKLCESIDRIASSYNKTEHHYSQYGDDKIFYACMPIYIDFNTISYVKVSLGINIKPLTTININTDDSEIRNITNKLIEVVTYYLLDQN